MGLEEKEELLGDHETPQWKVRLKAVLSHVGLCLTLTLYTVIGGIVFKELEYPTELANLAESDALVKQHRTNFVQAIVREQYRNGSVREFVNILERELHSYEVAVQDAAQSGILVPISQGTSIAELARWNHLQGIFFASTILTTIGYGNIAPITFSGRLFCILYALVGIPLCVSVIADLGSIAADSVSGVPSWLDKVSGTIKSLLSAFAALILLLLYISVGAVLFMFLEEDWTFFNSFYFCFITMTTIGFGDVVPEKPQYMLLCTLYILVGLGITSTIIEIVRNEYAKSWERLQALAEALRKLGEAGAQGSDVQAIQDDLKKAMAKLAGKREGSINWEKTFDTLIQNISKPKPEPKIVQIIVYETSV